MKNTLLYDGLSEEVKSKISYFNKVNKLPKSAFLRYKSDLEVQKLLSLSSKFIPEIKWPFYEMFLSDEDFFWILMTNEDTFSSKALLYGSYLVSGSEIKTILLRVQYELMTINMMNNWSDIMNELDLDITRHDFDVDVS